MKLIVLLILFLSLLVPRGYAGENEDIGDGQMAGYLLAPNERVPTEFNAGFSMYVAAWPLLEQYPGRQFQTGLFGTWMFPHFDPPINRPLKVNLYTDVEGGLGWWRDTRFATATPKFIMGGVDLNFRRWANGPGAGKGRDWDQPKGKYGVVQLSPWVVWPPDGLNLKQGTSGELFGYGYLPLPLTDPKESTAGQSVATGNQSWTLFLNTADFKGPVAFFAPYFWSQILTEKPELAGKLLDAAPVNPNRALQMETQHVPAKMATASDGTKYASVATVRYPRSDDGLTRVVHQIQSYKRSALWDSVEAWFGGGDVADGQVDSGAGYVHTFTGGGGATWKIHDETTPKSDQPLVNWDAIAKPIAMEGDTFGYDWTDKDTSDASLVNIPRFFRLSDTQNGKKGWQPVSASEVPAETGLLDAEFQPYERSEIEPYETPSDAESCWKTPGPVAGPFTAYPGDGSEVTYYWYRFADQPAMLNADLSDAERELVQERVEKLHRHWTRDREYLPPPEFGKLAEIDPALIVIPPKGLEVGYVPIVTRQALVNENETARAIRQRAYPNRGLNRSGEAAENSG